MFEEFFTSGSIDVIKGVGIGIELEKLKQNLEKKKGWVSAEKLGKPQGPNLYANGVEPKIEEGSGDFSILLAASRAEAEARDFYEEFSQKITDKEGSIFFKKLSEFEQTHYQLFSGILEASEVRVENAEMP